MDRERLEKTISVSGKVFTFSFSFALALFIQVYVIGVDENERLSYSLTGAGFAVSSLATVVAIKALEGQWGW